MLSLPYCCPVIDLNIGFAYKQYAERIRSAMHADSAACACDKHLFERYEFFYKFYNTVYHIHFVLVNRVCDENAVGFNGIDICKHIFYIVQKAVADFAAIFFADAHVSAADFNLRL